MSAATGATCVAVQDGLDTVAARGGFGMTAWRESDAREVVKVFLSCDIIPEDLPAALGH